MSRFSGGCETCYPHAGARVSRATVDGSGFTIVSGDGSAVSVRWSDVIEVFSYKRDLLGVDEIVLAFRQLLEPDRVIAISEECPGFADVSDAMQRELGVSDAWYLDTARKPFATDVRILLDRREQPPA